MNLFRVFTAGLMLSASFAIGAEPDRAAEFLAKAKQASGGAAWDRITSIYTKAHVEVGGLAGDLESWEDLRTGRGLTRYQLGAVSGAEGFDGQVAWSQDTSRQSKVEDGASAREAAINGAYRRSLAYWFPSRWAGTISYKGSEKDGSRQFHVIQITPKGGRSFELWIDAQTNLFARIVEHTGLETQTTILSDYRDVAGLKVPFATRVTNGEAQYDQIATVTTITLDVPIRDEQFTLPPPPPPDFTIADGQTAVTVPFTLTNNHIYLKVHLNGKGPFQFVCDTGGANVVTPALAKELGLTLEGKLQGRGVGESSQDVGFVKLQTLALGSLTLADQVFFVINLDSVRSAEGVSVEGLIGYEVFKRLVVAIDYEKSRLTLTLPTAFSYQGKGTTVPFTFDDSTPQVKGEIDGVPGTFSIDTGSRSALTILAPFAAKHDLVKRYRATTELVTGWGVGGPARNLLSRAKALRLGDVLVTDPVMEISVQRKGVFTDTYGAGNVGNGVLKRFNLIFDYGKKVIIFEPNANDSHPENHDRSGMWLNLADRGFQVIDVAPSSPAAKAGLQQGDIVVAIDGKKPDAMPLPALRERFKTDPVGTAFTLQVTNGTTQREVVLTLRDYVFERK